MWGGGEDEVEKSGESAMGDRLRDDREFLASLSSFCNCRGVSLYFIILRWVGVALTEAISLSIMSLTGDPLERRVTRHLSLSTCSSKRRIEVFCRCICCSKMD